MKKLFLIVPAVIIICTSCKTQQQAPEATAAAVEPEPTPAAAGSLPSDGNQTTEQQSKDFVYRFIVSFISIGEGPDREARQIFDTAIADWEKANMKDGARIIFEAVPWGREGEVDFCFTLKEISAGQQDQFISQVRERFKGHDLVQFAENEPCRHRR